MGSIQIVGWKVYLCRMNISVLHNVFPSVVVDNFDIIDLKENLSEERLDIYLDEKKIIPDSLKNREVISHGFTSETVIQDFPLRGKAVYLHLRRRKWLDKESNTIHTRTYDISFDGTQLTKEFVSFLKDAHREYITKL